MACALAFAVVGSADAGSVSGTATVGGVPAPNAVAYLERAAPTAMPADPPPAASTRTVMDQKNLAFVPPVLPVVRGTVVQFTNSDDVQHNVFSPSATAGKFDLGTYGPGAMRTVTFSEPGDVLVLCNIHMEMEAHILVLDSPYFSTVGGDGHFLIPDVPPGSYVLKIWQRRWLPATRPVDVAADADVRVDVDADAVSAR